MNVKIRTLSAWDIAYVRNIGSYVNVRPAWDRLLSWSFENVLYPPDQTFLGISLDDPVEVGEEACRHDSCVTLPEGFPRIAHPEMDFRTLPGGLYAVYPFFDTADRLSIAYHAIFDQWLPDNGYALDDRPMLEISRNDPSEDPEGKSKVEICIPIRASAG